MLSDNLKKTQLVIQLMEKDKVTSEDLAGGDKDVLRCTLCEYECKKSVTFKKHINTNHVDDTYECDKCHEKFKSMDNLADHISKEHDNKVVENSEKQIFGEIDKPALPDIKCPLCEDTFLTDQGFNIHINEHLAEIKSMDIEYLKNGHEIFACNLCNFESRDTNLIKKHLAQHTQ